MSLNIIAKKCLACEGNSSETEKGTAKCFACEGNNSETGNITAFL
jgi:hypothetical protein